MTKHHSRQGCTQQSGAHEPQCREQRFHLRSSAPASGPSAGLADVAAARRSDSHATGKITSSADHRDVGETSVGGASTERVAQTAAPPNNAPTIKPSQRRLRRGGGSEWNASGRVDRKSTRLNSSHVKISYA